ncbi:MAG TPA: HAD family phosphatase [Opitutaceae bacterium]|jgi:HAD superfamily hydrolase (TIGR01509 family)|nr:HAD family phosphatase [Opitutaceae bacterium]
MIRALVFDFDGLVIDTESALIDAYADIHAKYGMPFERQAFLESVGHADYAFDPWHAFEKRADRAALEVERQQRNRERMLEQPLLPGVVALIDGAAAAGLKLGVASNSRHPHVDGNLKRLGLFAKFQATVCREDVPSPKPEPDVYRLAVNRLGLRPHECVALEDSQTGILAAHRAGLKTVAAPGASTRHHDFSQADWTVASLAEVSVAALEKRFGG